MSDSQFAQMSEAIEPHWCGYGHGETPRLLVPCPLKEFDWHALPVGWECFIDDYGDVYYVK